MCNTMQRYVAALTRVAEGESTRKLLWVYRIMSRRMYVQHTATVCCSVLQIAVCCRLQCVADCSVLQIAVCCRQLPKTYQPASCCRSIHVYVDICMCNTRQQSVAVCCRQLPKTHQPASCCRSVNVYMYEYMCKHSAVVCCIVLQRVVESGSLIAHCSTCLDICVFCVLHIHLRILSCVYMWCLFLRLRIYACTRHYSNVLQCTAESCRE